MNLSAIRLTQLVLLVAGLVGWVALSNTLRREGKLESRPNVLHLKGSPFGRTLALAMRGPVDVYWHRGNVHEHGHEEGETCAECEHGSSAHEDHHGDDCEHGEECEHAHDEECEHGEICEHDEDCEHEHGPECEHAHSEDCEHGALCEHDADCEHDHSTHSEVPPASAPKESGVRPFLLERIGSMRKAFYSRTNTRGDSKLHRAYLMGETQRRLEISYHMDPTNPYGYGAYFLFLSEALARVEGEANETGVVTRRRRAALELADYTVKYCLNFQDEAPAMITAATAAHDCLQIHLTQPEPNLELAGEYLGILDGCLHQYDALRHQMIENGTWQKFSPARRTELDQAHNLVRNLQRGVHQVFGRLTAPASAPATDPSS